jgi:hypothetical protein
MMISHTFFSSSIFVCSSFCSSAPAHEVGFLVVATLMILFASNSFKGINRQRSKAVFSSKTQCAFLHAGI